MGIDFTVIKPDVDESVLPNERPEDYVQRLSLEKALTVAGSLDISTAYVLAADTTVIHEGDILGKPEDEDEARRMLLRLRSQTHRVCTGFTLLSIENSTVEKQITDLDCTDVHMRFYAASEMERWVMSGAAFDKAGGYAIQSSLFNPVERIDGSYNNVVGLPTEALEVALLDIGYVSTGSNGSED
jgi:septum formation protein